MVQHKYNLSERLGIVAEWHRDGLIRTETEVRDWLFQRTDAEITDILRQISRCL
jgi:hypothetical protein